MEATTLEHEIGRGGELLHYVAAVRTGAKNVRCVSVVGHPYVCPLFGTAAAVEVEARHLPVSPDAHGMTILDEGYKVAYGHFLVGVEWNCKPSQRVEMRFVEHKIGVIVPITSNFG